MRQIRALVARALIAAAVATAAACERNSLPLPTETLDAGVENVGGLIAPPKQPPAPRKGMLWIEPGALVAGTPPDLLPRVADEELPGEQVILKGFYMDVLPYPNEDGAIPLTNVNFAQAQGLCAAQSKRLCTELEWERSCKGPNNFVYEYGDRYRPDRCNMGFSPGMRPSGLLVGCKSDFGVRDLHGGAWEWTDSSWNRGGVSQLIATRGGNAANGELVGRCANASARSPETISGNLGFRCCAGPKNLIAVSLDVKRSARITAERRVDRELLSRFLKSVPDQVRTKVPDIDHFAPLNQWRWHPAGNDAITLLGGCTTTKLPLCGIIVGREARSEFLGWAGSGIRLATLHTAKSATDIWLLGGDEGGPFSRRIAYTWGRVLVLEHERQGPKQKSR